MFFSGDSYQILRSWIDGPVRLSAHARARLVKLAKPLGAAIREIVSIVKPDTLRRWINQSRARRSSRGAPAPHAGGDPNADPEHGAADGAWPDAPAGRTGQAPVRVGERTNEFFAERAGLATLRRRQPCGRGDRRQEFDHAQTSSVRDLRCD